MRVLGVGEVGQHPSLFSSLITKNDHHEASVTFGKQEDEERGSYL
jgi:hypothetical protein